MAFYLVLNCRNTKPVTYAERVTYSFLLVHKIKGKPVHQKRYLQERLGFDKRTISAHCKKLESLGLLKSHGTRRVEALQPKDNWLIQANNKLGYSFVKVYEPRPETGISRRTADLYWLLHSLAGGEGGIAKASILALAGMLSTGREAIRRYIRSLTAKGMVQRVEDGMKVIRNDSCWLMEEKPSGAKKEGTLFDNASSKQVVHAAPKTPTDYVAWVREGLEPFPEKKVIFEEILRQIEQDGAQDTLNNNLGLFYDSFNQMHYGPMGENATLFHLGSSLARCYGDWKKFGAKQSMIKKKEFRAMLRA